jgi:ATP-dependent DNA helicase RecG
MFVEGINIELKEKYIDDIKKTIVAFGNTSGGKIYIGITDDGKVKGIENYDDVILKLSNSIRDSIKPDITLFTKCYVETIDEKKVVIVDVQKGSSSPYYIAAKGIRPQGVYVRQAASSVPATETMIIKMIKDTDGNKYEEIRSLNQELTFESLEKEFKEARLPIEESQKKTMSIIGHDGLFTNLAYILSDQCTHTIKVAVYEGFTKSVFKDRFEFDGSIIKQLHDTYDFINRYNRTRSEFNGLKRLDIKEYPEIAIREALLNAIVHRDYSYSGSILISIFDDKIELVTIGGLVTGFTKEDILLGVSVLRNKNLGNVFYRLKLIEAYGTGIQKIFESYNGYSQEPKLEITDNAFKITLPSTLVNQNVVKETREIYLKDSEVIILKMFDENRFLVRKNIEERLEISQAMAVKLLRGLLEKSLIEKVGQGKNTRYVKR